MIKNKTLFQQLHEANEKIKVLEMNNKDTVDSYNVIIHELKEQLADTKENEKHYIDKCFSLEEQLAEKTEAFENSQNGMLNLIKYKNELVQQLEQKEFELKAADHVLAEKEKEIESNEAVFAHWILHNYKPYEDGMAMVWRNINPDIDTYHTSKQLYEIFKHNQTK
jgi:chromosome segregation ATPase